MIRRGYTKNVRKRKPWKPKPPRLRPKLSPTALQAFSMAVRERDGFRCQLCGSKKNPQAHHVLSKFYRPQHAYDTSQGITLCKSCHISRRGVHGGAIPKNKWIGELRRMFRSNRISMARDLVERIRRRGKRIEKTSKGRRTQNLPSMRPKVSKRKSKRTKIPSKSRKKNR